MERTLNDKFELWKEASSAYYNSDEPIMSDAEFDALQEDLICNGTQIIKDFIKNSIMRDSGFEDVSSFNETDNKDAGKQLSLNKIKWQSLGTTPSEIFDFFNTIKDKNAEYFVSPKFDGCSIKIDIQNIRNIIITTRGGHNITNKLINNPSIQDALTKYSQNIDFIVGEIVIPKDIFKQKYIENFSNPRNYVAGVLKPSTQDFNREQIDELIFVPCTDGVNPLLLNGYWEKIHLNWNFFASFDFEKYYTHLKSEQFPFLCDGLVISTNVQERKVKNNYPLNMVAIKFPSPQSKSKVLGLEWTQKKSNRLTPTILIEPVELDGSVVSRCSGHSYNTLFNIHKMGIGSEILITKSGDIIPKIVKVLTTSNKPLNMPNVPHKIDGAHLIVDGYEYDTSNITKFRNAFKKLEIKNIGDVVCSIIGSVCDNDIIEIFNPKLKVSFLSKLGPDSANYRNFSKIYDIKTIYLSDLIYMLQFNNVGEVLSKRLADIMTKRNKDVSGISKEVLIDVVQGDGIRKIQNSINTLKEYGVNIILEHIPDTNNISIEMTGEPGEGTKEQWLKSIQQIFPNVIHLPLTKNTNYLITNDLNSNTTKMNKARKYNVNIVLYNDFTKVLKNL